MATSQPLWISSSSSRFRMEFVNIESSDGIKLSARLFKASSNGNEGKSNLAVVLVHPYTVLGGSQGLLRGIAEGLAQRGFTALTFDMRGAGRSSGWASLTGSSEIQDVIGVCKWVVENLKPDGIVLVGSSAGLFLRSLLFISLLFFFFFFFFWWNFYWFWWDVFVFVHGLELFFGSV